MKLPLQGLNDYAAHLVETMVAVETKHDGWGVAARLERMRPAIYTRGGKALDLPHIIEAMIDVLPAGYFFHAELIHPDGLQAVKTAIATKDSRLQLMVFDMPSESVFVDGLDKRYYVDRKRRLHAALEDLTKDSPIHSVDALTMKPDEVYSYFETRVRDGEEGVVIKRLGSCYNAGKTNDWLRLKAVQTQDCEIVGMTPHSKHPDQIGAFEVLDENGILCKVGAGLPEDVRREAKERPKKFIGMLAEVSHRGKYDSGKMRSTAFLRLRPDKEAS